MESWESVDRSLILHAILMEGYLSEVSNEFYSSIEIPYSDRQEKGHPTFLWELVFWLKGGLMKWLENTSQL